MLLIFLSGCAHLDQYARDNYCSPHGAYEKGVNDGVTGWAMNSRWATVCELSDKELAVTKYQEGYVVGLQNATKKVVVKHENAEKTTIQKPKLRQSADLYGCTVGGVN